MAQQFTQFINAIRQKLIASWASLVDEARHCSDCQALVSPWDTVCPDCGMANPVRVTISPVLYAAFGGGVLLLLLVVQWL